MSEFPSCSQCKSIYTYQSGQQLACSECGYEWEADKTVEQDEILEEGFIVKDSNGNRLQSGDSIIIIKDLQVKGAPKPIKAGTKVKNIKLVDGDHNIDCKIEGFGAMALKSEFVRKG